MGLDERNIIIIALLIAFLVHYIRLNLRVWRLEKGIIYAVSKDVKLRNSIHLAHRNLDGSLEYETNFFKDGDVYSLNDAREIAKICNGAVVNKHTKEIIEDYRECVDK